MLQYPPHIFFRDAVVDGAGRLQAYGGPGLAGVRVARAIQEDSHRIEKQGGNMNVREGTKRKDACLNAESSIT